MRDEGVQVDPLNFDFGTKLSADDSSLWEELTKRGVLRSIWNHFYNSLGKGLTFLPNEGGLLDTPHFEVRRLTMGRSRLVERSCGPHRAR
jgi:hypothetical protein